QGCTHGAYPRAYLRTRKLRLAAAFKVRRAHTNVDASDPRARPYTRPVRRRRWNGRVGLALIVVGLAVVGLNIRETLDPVVLTLTENHGLHLSDFVGSAI